ncbi:MAG: disulfide bond formation protein B [Sphingomonas sp.]|jgi:disulfide bond formation protein DsbB
MSRSARTRLENLRFIMNEVYTLGMMAVIAAVLTAAMVMQYALGELPCPLCLLQRVAMLGVCFGLMQNFRNGFSDRNLGYSLLFSVFLLVVSIRQTLLDIYPRPGHEYVGSAVLGLHMPVWSILIAMALITAFAIKLCVIGTEDGAKPPVRQSVFGRVAMLLSLYVIAIALINLGSVVLQCGLGECHTARYALL